MKQYVVVITIIFLAGCTATTLSPQERFHALQELNGALGATYDVTPPATYTDNVEMGVAWYGDTRKATIETGGLRSDAYTVTTTVGNTTTVCQTDEPRDDHTVYECERASNMLGGSSEYSGVFDVALNITESSLNYTGEYNVAGRTCHEFTADLNATEGVERRSKICLDEATGRPLTVELQRPDQDLVTNEADWSSVVVMNATETRSVEEDDAQPPVPFTVERSYASYSDNEAHAVITSHVGFDASLDAGGLAEGSVDVSMQAGETRHVVLSVGDVSNASVDRPFVEGTTADIPVCAGSNCHSPGARDPCIRESSNPSSCSEASRCVYDDETSVCASKPETCYGVDRAVCDGTRTQRGSTCEWTGYRCEPSKETVDEPRAPELPRVDEGGDRSQYNVSAETPKIAYWCGKVNQHREGGEWVTDPDGSSGCSEDKLSYCQKFYPGTESVEPAGEERITGWRQAGNVGSSTVTKQTYRCVR